MNNCTGKIEEHKSNTGIDGTICVLHKLRNWFKNIHSHNGTYTHHPPESFQSAATFTPIGRIGFDTSDQTRSKMLILLPSIKESSLKKKVRLLKTIQNKCVVNGTIPD